MLSKWKALFNFFGYIISEADLEFAKKITSKIPKFLDFTSEKMNCNIFDKFRVWCEGQLIGSFYM